MIFNVILLVVFSICFAMLLSEGLWTNLLTFFNVLFAALMATCLFEPLADMLEGYASSFTYLLDFLSIWVIFALSLLVFRTVTDSLSQVSVRFKGPVDPAGSALLAAAIGWLMVCLTSMAFHTAPLARNFCGFRPEPDARVLFGLAPDLHWLGYAQRVSKGALATSAAEGGEDAVNAFDPNSEFILRYGQRRANFQRLPSFRVTR